MGEEGESGAAAHEAHVLVVSHDQAARWTVSDILLDGALHVSQAATAGVVETLLRAPRAFDLVMVVLSAEEMPCVGLPHRARSVDPELPILVLDAQTANSPAVLQMARTTMARWPLRPRPALV